MRRYAGRVSPTADDLRDRASGSPAGLLANAIGGWWWADPAAALVIAAAVAGREGVEAWRGDLCCDDC